MWHERRLPRLPLRRREAQPLKTSALPARRRKGRKDPKKLIAGRLAAPGEEWSWVRS